MGRLQFQPGYDSVHNIVFAFSPDGTSIAGLSDTTLYLWDALTGTPREPVYCGETFGAYPVFWADNNYVFARGTLVHTGEQIPIWKYDGLSGEDFAYGGFYWDAKRDPWNKGLSLTPIKIPHEDMPQLPELTDEDKFCVRPDMSVKISIDSGVPDADKLREDWTKKLEANGLVISGSGEITLHARISQGEEKEAYFHRGFGPFATGPVVGHAKVRPHIYSVAFEKNGEVLWQDTMNSGSPSFSLSEIESKSIQNWSMKNRSPA